MRKERQRWVTTWRIVCRTSSITELAEKVRLLQYYNLFGGKHIFFSDPNCTVIIIQVEVNLVPYS